MGTLTTKLTNRSKNTKNRFVTFDTFVFSWLFVSFQMIGVAERETARRHLPRRAKRLGELGIGLRDLFGERREFLVDAREPRLVFLHVALLFQVAPEKAHRFEQLRQQDRALMFHRMAFIVRAAQSISMR